MPRPRPKPRKEVKPPKLSVTLPPAKKSSKQSKVPAKTKDVPQNDLYFGDCFDILKELVEKHKEPFIDLIYIDPPFNSKRNYNVLFESINMKDANAQKHAFADTWSNVVYVVELNNLAELSKDLYEFLTMLDKSKSVSDSAVAYLTTMSIRIYYMHKLLKSTGSFYLHCDPTMSHYLKMACDMIFGEKNFVNEIIWKRTSTKNDYVQGAVNFPRVHDCILYYKKDKKPFFDQPFSPHSEDYINQSYNLFDENGRRYQLTDLSAPGAGTRGHPKYEFMGVTRYWRYNKEKMEGLLKEGRIVQTKAGNVPRYKRYLDEMKGVAIGDCWFDISPLQGQSEERLGYPTQKPVALMERIIKASTNEGDVVADFFCGCGTTIAAAQNLKRKWLGADISHLAIKLILERLIKSNGDKIKSDIGLHGFPKDVDSAKMLARETENGRFGFQEWAIEFLLRGVVNTKKVADGGYDGYLTYNSENGKKFVLIETKSGNVTVKNVREFIQVIDKQKAAAGIFVCFKDQVTKEMTKEAKLAGSIKMGKMDTGMDKIQILTIDEILTGKMPHLPNVISTFKQAERKQETQNAPTLF